MSELPNAQILAMACLASLLVSATSVIAEPESKPAVPAATEPAAPAKPDASAPTATAVSAPAIELNKLEPVEKGCRAYVVVNNTSDKAYQSYKIDLVLFQTDGVIGKRFSIDLAPLKPQKKTVKLFEVDGMACDKIGSLLVNDVMDCKTDAGPVDNCLQTLTTSSLGKVQLSK